MDRLLIDWRKAQAGRAYVVWVRDGVGGAGYALLGRQPPVVEVKYIALK